MYSSAYLERREGSDSFFVPKAVFELWTTLLIVAFVLWTGTTFLTTQYRLYGDILRSSLSILIPVAVLGTGILWWVPRGKSYSNILARGVIFVLIFGGLIRGISVQRNRIEWFLSLDSEQQERMQGRRNRQPSHQRRTVTVTFREGYRTDEWEGFIEELNWSLFDYQVDSGRVRVVQCDTQEYVAEVDTSSDLVLIREAFADQISDIQWFEACVTQMEVTGHVQNAFERNLSDYRMRVGIGSEVIDIDWADPEVEE